jgi:SAM-dependent methyltransferase
MTNNNYFKFRNINSDFYNNYTVPAYLLSKLNSNSKILDYGCGFGQLTLALKQNGYSFIEGADINKPAIEYLISKGVVVHDLNENINFYKEMDSRYDCVIISHVLEHFPKDEIISRLQQIRGLLDKGGQLIVMVPNAQSNTGCYWAYEDFTHNTLFTAGSLYYVLRASGFSQVEFIDIDCTAGMTFLRKLAKKFLLSIYRFNLKLWNKVTSSSFHAPSQEIFSYEIKAVAREE